MKKASKILLLIGGIFGLLAAILALLSGVTVFGFMQFFGLGYTGVGIFSLLLDLEVFDLGFKIFGAIEPDIMYIVEGVLMIVLSFAVVAVQVVVFIVQLIAGIIGLKSRGKNEKKGLYIANFVFAGLIFFIFGSGFLGYIAEIVLVVGSILGLIAMKKSQQEEQPIEAVDASEVVDVK